MATARRKDNDADLDKFAEHRVVMMNHKAEKHLELLALELVDLGSSSYAAGIRALAFTSISLLANLDEPELASDLERIKSYCDELLEEPTAA